MKMDLIEWLPSYNVCVKSDTDWVVDSMEMHAIMNKYIVA